MQRPAINGECLPQLLSTVFIEIRSLMHSRDHSSSARTGWPLRRRDSLVSTLQGTPPCLIFICGLWESELRTSRLHSECSTHGVYSWQMECFELKQFTSLSWIFKLLGPNSSLFCREPLRHTVNEMQFPKQRVQKENLKQLLPCCETLLPLFPYKGSRVNKAVQRRWRGKVRKKCLWPSSLLFLHGCVCGICTCTCTPTCLWVYICAHECVSLSLTSGDFLNSCLPYSYLEVESLTQTQRSWIQ